MVIAACSHCRWYSRWGCTWPHWCQLYCWVSAEDSWHRCLRDSTRSSANIDGRFSPRSPVLCYSDWPEYWKLFCSWYVRVCAGNYYAPPLIGGSIKRRFCLTSVCRVAYVGPKSRTERPRKTKIGTEVAHVRDDSDTTSKFKRSKVKVIRPLYLPPC